LQKSVSLGQNEIRRVGGRGIELEEQSSGGPVFRESVWWCVTWYRVTGGRAGEAFVPRKGKKGFVRRRSRVGLGFGGLERGEGEQ
jgi:hypothetical protein